MIKDSGAGGIVRPIDDSYENLAISLAFYFLFVCGRGILFYFFVWEGVLTIDPSVPSGSVHAL